MSETTPKPSAATDRSDVILDAAFHTFATYGFRRATMDDIARAAEMSRTALYLFYRNKEDIFLSLARRYFDESVQDVKAALADPSRPVADTLLAAFRAKDGKFMDVVLGTPHGSELLDAGFSISADIAREGEQAMKQALAEWLARLPLQQGVDTPLQIADTILIALKGLKSSAKSLNDYHEAQARMARLFARALGLA